MSTPELDELYLAALELDDAGDEERALQLFREGAAKGDDSAMNSIGLAYASGRGVPRDKDEAIRWLKKAWRVEKQIYIGLNIAKIYEEMGQRELALKWWNKLIAMGDVSAKWELANCLLKARSGRPTRRIVALVQAVAEAEGGVTVTWGEQEEAQELLDTWAATDDAR